MSYIYILKYKNILKNIYHFYIIGHESFDISILKIKIFLKSLHTILLNMQMNTLTGLPG